MKKVKSFRQSLKDVIDEKDNALGAVLRKLPCMQPFIGEHGIAGRAVSIVDTTDVCKLLHVSPRTLFTLRRNGTIPFSRVGRKVYYSRQDIENVLRNNNIMFEIHSHDRNK